jgi:hypothetical protein
VSGKACLRVAQRLCPLDAPVQNWTEKCVSPAARCLGRVDPRRHQENHNEELSGLRKYEDPSIQAQGNCGEHNSCHDLR